MRPGRSAVAAGIALSVVAFGAGVCVGTYLERSKKLRGPDAQSRPAEPVAAQQELHGAERRRPARPVIQSTYYPWAEEGKGGAYVVKSRDWLAVEDDAGLKQRAAMFLRPPRLLAARNYAAQSPENPKGPIDVYSVYNSEELRARVHMVHWYHGDHGYEGTAWHTVFDLGLAGGHELVFLDLDRDGSREVITVLHGANTTGPIILDFGRPRGEEIVFEGLPPSKAHEWKFADLDGDGQYECVEVTHGAAVNRWRDSDRQLPFSDDENVYITYGLEGEKYVLKEFLRKDPTESLSP